MFDDRFKNIKISWVRVRDMYADVKGLERKNLAKKLL